MQVRNLSLALIAMLFAGAAASSCQAQDGFAGGYGFGTGFGIGNRFPCPGGAAGSCHGLAVPAFGYPFTIGGFQFVQREEEPPYFAKYPPVYYSHIVRRPYGVSPYAAPPGIAPVEMAVPAVQPVTISNPYFNDPIQLPVGDQAADSGSNAPMIETPASTAEPESVEQESPVTEPQPPRRRRRQ